MARNFTINLPASAFVPDEDAQLATSDNPCSFEVHKGRLAMAFDDGADEEAAVSVEFQWPDEYTGSGTLYAELLLAAASDTTNDTQFDVRVEAKTPDADTLDMEAATSWDTANTGTISLATTTAGDPLTITVTLTNKDSVASGDSVRVGIRRDTLSANDDASGDIFVYSVTLYEE